MSDPQEQPSSTPPDAGWPAQAPAALSPVIDEWYPATLSESFQVTATDDGKAETAPLKECLDAGNHLILIISKPKPGQAALKVSLQRIEAHLATLGDVVMSAGITCLNRPPPPPPPPPAPPTPPAKAA